MFKKGERVRLTNDLMHLRTIFNGAEVSPGRLTKQLSAGTDLTVNCHYADGQVECECNGAYYYPDAGDLELID